MVFASVFFKNFEIQRLVNALQLLVFIFKNFAIRKLPSIWYSKIHYPVYGLGALLTIYDTTRNFIVYPSTVYAVIFEGRKIRGFRCSASNRELLVLENFYKKAII